MSWHPVPAFRIASGAPNPSLCAAGANGKSRSGQTHGSLGPEIHVTSSGNQMAGKMLGEPFRFGDVQIPWLTACLCVCDRFLGAFVLLGLGNTHSSTLSGRGRWPYPSARLGG